MPVKAEAPLGVIFTVPSLFTIESAVVLADAGIAETLAVALAADALVLRFRVLEPTFTEIALLLVVVGRSRMFPSVDAAAGALAVKLWPSTMIVEVPPSRCQSRGVDPYPVRLGLPGTPSFMLQSFLIPFPRNGSGLRGKPGLLARLPTALTVSWRDSC